MSTYFLKITDLHELSELSILVSYRENKKVEPDERILSVFFDLYQALLVQLSADKMKRKN